MNYTIMFYQGADEFAARKDPARYAAFWAYRLGCGGAVI
jgi:hypothetical protein